MKKLILALSTSALLLLSVPSYADKSPQDMKVNINNATVQELDERLVGVGRRIAEEIVKHRDAHGPFQSLDDLDKVKFVGAKVIAKNKGTIIFD